MRTLLHQFIVTHRKGGFLLGIGITAALFAVIAIGLPKLRLVGAGVDDHFAILENTETGKQDLFEINSQVFGEAKLVAIEDDKVVLQQGTKKLTLTTKGSSVVNTNSSTSDMERAQLAQTNDTEANANESHRGYTEYQILPME